MFNVSWSPWLESRSELERLQNQLRRRAAGHGNVAQGRAPAAYPPVNVWVDDERLYVEAELPGLDLADLEIVVNNANQLTLSGQRREPVEQSGGWYRRERSYGAFQRVIDLPLEVAADKVTAQFRQGVLRVELPRTEQRQPRRIEVRAV